MFLEVPHMWKAINKYTLACFRVIVRMKPDNLWKHLGPWFTNGCCSFIHPYNIYMLNTCSVLDIVSALCWKSVLHKIQDKCKIIKTILNITCISGFPLYWMTQRIISPLSEKQQVNHESWIVHILWSELIWPYFNSNFNMVY